MTLFGFSIFLAIFGGMWWANARRWRTLAQRYKATPQVAHDKRIMQSVVLVGRGGFNSLKGIVTVELHHSGVSLRILPPFSVFHAPLYVPYSDITGWQTSWYVNAKSTELSFRLEPDIKMIVPAELAEWIGAASGQKMTLQESEPPRGKAGQGWRAALLLHACIGVLTVGYVCFTLLSGQRF